MQKDTPSERSYFRAPAELVVHYGPDTPQARQIMAMDADIWQAQSELESSARQVVEDSTVSDNMKPFLNMILWLDFKVDLILHHLRTNELLSHFPNVEKTTDLSGSGFGLKPGSKLKPGMRIIISLTLPDALSRPVFAVGEAVRRNDASQDDQAAAAVRFIEISEADRERLIRFTFRQQRRDLARRAGKEQN